MKIEFRFFTKNGSSGNVTIFFLKVEFLESLL